jgi:hypothetical protein
MEVLIIPNVLKSLLLMVEIEQVLLATPFIVMCKAVV